MSQNESPERLPIGLGRLHGRETQRRQTTRRIVDEHDQRAARPAPSNQSPADAMNSGNGSALQDRGKRRTMRIVQPRPLPGRISIDQPFRPVCVELEEPIANDLKRHAADLGRLVT